MRRFQDIVGHIQIIEHFQNAVKMDKISHAYILSGEEGSGKSALADVFASVLECEKGGIEPCGECHSCKQAESRNHPDIIWVRHEKPTSIGVEDVRDQVVSDMQIKPYSSPYKIYIIDEAQKLTQQAQNALLKTIEEPPAYGVIMLLTTNKEAFLQTIISRCIILQTKPIDNSLIRSYLTEHFQVTEERINTCIVFAQGNLGKAVKLAESDTFNEMRNHVINTMRNISRMDLSMLIKVLKEVEEYKIDMIDYLDMVLVWFRDVLLFKVARDVNSLIFREELTALTKQAEVVSYEGLEAIITALSKAKSRLKANVNFETAIELLLLTIKENLK